MSWTVVRWKNHFIYHTGYPPEKWLPHYSTFETSKIERTRLINVGAEMIIIQEFETKEKALRFQRNITDCL